VIPQLRRFEPRREHTRAHTGIAVVSRDGVDALEIQSFPAAVVGTGANEPDQLLNDYIDWSLFLNISCWVSAQSNVSKCIEAFKASMAAMPLTPFRTSRQVLVRRGAWSGPFQ
jgi:hypothetical protein